MADFDQKLFLAWRRGEGREEAWSELWRLLYHVAHKYCRRFCRDDFTAREMAAEAFTRTVMEIERLMSLGKIEWSEEKSFVKVARVRLYSRCLDQVRLFVSRSQRTLSLDAPVSDGDGEAVAFLDLLGFEGETPEEKLLAEENRKLKVKNVHSMVRLVAAAREACRDSSALKKWLEWLEEYLRGCLAGTLALGLPKDKTLSLDELLSVSNLESLDVNLTEMINYLVEKNRSARPKSDEDSDDREKKERSDVYTALKRIRIKLKKLREKGG